MIQVAKKVLRFFGNLRTLFKITNYYLINTFLFPMKYTPGARPCDASLAFTFCLMMRPSTATTLTSLLELLISTSSIDVSFLSISKCNSGAFDGVIMFPSFHVNSM